MGDQLSGQELHDRARELNIEGRSTMSADELRAAVAAAMAEPSKPDPEPEPSSDLARDTTHFENVVDITPDTGEITSRSAEARIVALQALLHLADCNCQIDGVFGPGTRKSVALFQSRGGVEPTGRADTTTLAALATLFLGN